MNKASVSHHATQEPGDFLVSVVIPCLNEEKSIGKCVDEVVAAQRVLGRPVQIIIVDNGSTDMSKDIVAKKLAHLPGSLLVTEPIRGYGQAYRSGFAHAVAPYIFMSDGDGSYDFGEIPRFVKELERGADLVIGDRFGQQMQKDAMPFAHRYIGNPVLSSIFRFLFKVKVHDVHSGMRAFRRSLLAGIEFHSSGMEFASEMIATLGHGGASIREIPIGYRPRIGESKLRPLRDGLRHISYMLRQPSPLFRIMMAVVIMGAIAVRCVPLAPIVTHDAMWVRSTVYVSDASGYKNFGMQIYRYGLGSLASDRANHADIAPPTAFRTPLYPIFIAALFWLFGTQPTSILVAQLCIDLLTLILVFLILKRITRSRWAGLAGAAFYAFSPLSIMYASSLYAECLFTFFLMASIYAFVLMRESQGRERLWRAAFVGVLIGMTALIKPVGMYAIIIYLFALALDAFQESRFKLFGPKSYAPAALIMLVMFAATLSPWQFRNLLVYGHYALTFQQGRELLVWRVGSCQARQNNMDLPTTWRDIQKPFLSIPDYFVRSAAEQTAALSYMRAHPMAMLECHLAGVKNFFFATRLFAISPSNVSTPLSGYISSLFDRHTMIIASRVYYGLLFIIYALACIGAVCMLSRRHDRSLGFILLGLIFYISQASGIDGYSRYIAPLQPVLIILTVTGLIFLIHRYRRNIRSII